uniref:CAAX prenyl protease n=1 Tax=Heterosigma akashiwo TaxID=2829 RepID=A0A6V1WI57_HETAK
MQIPTYRQEGWTEPSIPFLEGAIVLALVVFLFETYLSFRQHQLYKQKEIPAALMSVCMEVDSQASKKAGPSAEEKAAIEKLEGKEREEAEERLLPLAERMGRKFGKAQAYSLDKSTFGVVSSTIDIVLDNVLLLLGFMPYLWDTAERAVARCGGDPDASEVWTSLAFFLLNFVVSDLFHTPFALYRNFVLEEKHGFNKLTLRLWASDKAKEYALTAALGSLFLGAVVKVIRWGGDLFYLYAWAFSAAVMLFMMTIYPVFIAPLFNKYEALPEGSLRDAIEALAARVSFPLTKLYTVDGSRRSAHSNAYMYGFHKNKRIVLYDTLLKQAQEEEVVAILGHELGHWKMWHTVQGLGVSLAYTFVMLWSFGFVMNSDALYTSFGFSSEKPYKPVVIGITLFSQTLWAVVGHVVGFLMNANSRRNEFQADKFAVDLGYSKQLQRGLLKIQIENLGSMVPDKWYAAYHYTHPATVERLRAMQDQKAKAA